MRRKDKEIKNMTAIEAIIKRAQVCRLACVDDGKPYIVPLCFGYEAGTLYFHAAQAGRKLDILRKNPQVCFEFDIDQELVRGQNACDWGMNYRSIIGFGTASLLETPEAKKAALDCIMQHYDAPGPYEYSDASLARTLVIKVDIEQMTGKAAGYAVETEQ
ncbi:pyridoxamine 5'-phosphate oxidase-related FMN-binding [Candidatus Vecturithrix granuli]|uniref:Pyridoxamine 5'-phosphate oxidase-related FMN-binding n=1 Tax=Vecturithrix granuli TaxID=1499967 RepID=A0A081C275_VECG1|nr:pyridoxamine 5'-phosphate oxidase-related FMN-binding [Candidatus Vecturithrix granuli]